MMCGSTFVSDALLARKGRTQEAAAYYQAALAAQPTAAVHGVIATVANRQARYNEAVAHWTEAIRLKPNVDSYHLFLGHNLMYEFRYRRSHRCISTRDRALGTGV